MDMCRFPDCKSVLKRLKELNLLVSDKDRYLSRFKLGSDDNAVLVAGYGIRLRTEEQEKEKSEFVSIKDKKNMEQLNLVGINPFAEN